MAIGKEQFNLDLLTIIIAPLGNENGLSGSARRGHYLLWPSKWDRGVAQCGGSDAAAL